MVAIPACLWRFGLIVRALIAGLALGVFVGLLAWIGSDVAAPALVVLVVVTLVYGAFMARWMSKVLARGRGRVSWLYFAFFPIEAWWWPLRQGAQDRPKIVEHLGILDG
jgi:hypothetical protein